jgi:hypothetical protein
LREIPIKNQEIIRGNSNENLRNNSRIIQENQYKFQFKKSRIIREISVEIPIKNQEIIQGNSNEKLRNNRRLIRENQ